MDDALGGHGACADAVAVGGGLLVIGDTVKVLPAGRGCSPVGRGQFSR